MYTEMEIKHGKKQDLDIPYIGYTVNYISNNDPVLTVYGIKLVNSI